MRKLYVGVAGLLVAALAVQFFLAAVGAFDAAPRTEAFNPHRTLGYLLLLLSLVATGAGALARAPGRLIGQTAVIVGLAVVQPVIAVVARAVEDSGSGTASTLVFGLHALTALAMLFTAREVLTGAVRHSRATGGAATAPVRPATPAGG